MRKNQSNVKFLDDFTHISWSYKAESSGKLAFTGITVHLVLHRLCGFCPVGVECFMESILGVFFLSGLYYRIPLSVGPFEHKHAIIKHVSFYYHDHDVLHFYEFYINDSLLLPHLIQTALARLASFQWFSDKGYITGSVQCYF